VIDPAGIRTLSEALWAGPRASGRFGRCAKAAVFQELYTRPMRGGGTGRAKLPERWATRPNALSQGT